MTEEAKARKRELRKIRNARNRDALREKNRAWRLANPEKVKAYDSKKRKTDKCKARMSAYLKAYRSTNAESLATKAKKSRELNRGSLARKHKTYYANNRERLLDDMHRRYHALTPDQKLELNSKARARNRRTYLLRRDRLNEYQRNRYWADPEKPRARCREYSRKNRAVIYSRNAKRRLALEASANPTADTFYKYVRSLRTVNCYYCGESVRGKEAHVDHIVAIANGGNHCSSNLAASCPKCNLSKNAKPLTEWSCTSQPLLNL